MKNPPAMWSVSATILVGLSLLAHLPQDPIPSPEPGGRGSIVGRVVSSDGTAIPGVAVTATQLPDGPGRSTVTSEDGAFRFFALAPGHYHIRVSSPGFGEMTRDISVGSAETARLTLVLDIGPIPDADPGSGGGGGSGGDIQVFEKRLADDLEVLEWLAELTGDHELISVIPVEKEISLFVAERLGAEGRRVEVYPVHGRLQAADLQRRLRLRPNRTFLGIHPLTEDSYLLVVRDE
jgi:hypothetical protein